MKNLPIILLKKNNNIEYFTDGIFISDVSSTEARYSRWKYNTIPTKNIGITFVFKDKKKCVQ